MANGENYFAVLDYAELIKSKVYFCKILACATSVI